MDFDVAIIGLGPSGLAAASFLSKYGLNVVGIDALTEPYSFPRAAAIDDWAQRIIYSSWDKKELQQQFDTDLAIELVDANGNLLLQMPSIETSNGFPGNSMFYQPGLESYFRANLDPKVRTYYGWNCVDIITNSGDGTYNIEIAGQDAAAKILKSRFVLGCDGGSSFVRRRFFGSEFPGTSFVEVGTWFVVDAQGVGKCKQKKSLLQSLRFICDSKRPGLDTPLLGNKSRWEFALELNEEEPDDETLKTWILARGLPLEDYSKLQFQRKARYTFHSRMVDRYRNGNVILVGDAAHLQPAFRGQGMSSAMHDAANLGWKLAYVIKGWANAEILDSYEAERRDRVIMTACIATWLGELIASRSRVFEMVRNVVMKVLWRMPVVARLMREDKLTVASMKLSRGLIDPKCRCSGELLPNFKLTSDRRIDEILGNVAFSLVVFGRGEYNALLQEEEEGKKREWVQVVLLQDEDLIFDQNDGKLRCEYNKLKKMVGKGKTLIVRPDKHILGIEEAGEAAFSRVDSTLTAPSIKNGSQMSKLTLLFFRTVSPKMVAAFALVNTSLLGSMAAYYFYNRK